jgi:hypothetical protein
MAYVGVTNQLVSSATNVSGYALFVIKEALKLAGWTVVTSGTGTAGTTGAGDLITSGPNTAIGGFARANAWVRMREPSSGTREYILQNGTSDSDNRTIVKYSRATGFTVGATATVSPTTGGGDGVMVIGTGTDAAPVQTTWLPTIGTNGYYHCVASDTANNGVWGWWWYGYATNPVGTQRLLGTEAVAPGSTPVQDQDPSIRYRDNIYDTSVTVAWWEAYGLTGAVYRTAGSLGVIYNLAGSQQIVTSFSGLNPYTGLVGLYPTFVGLNLVPTKGFTTETLVGGRPSNATDTFNLSTAQPKITIYGTNGVRMMATPWITNVVPL